MTTGRFGNYDWIANAFEGEDLYLVASGPSILNSVPTADGAPDFSFLHGAGRVAALNHTFMFLPFADVFVFLDSGVCQKMGRDIHYGEEYRTVTSSSSGLHPKGNVSVIRTISFTQYKNGPAVCYSKDPSRGLWANYSTGVFAISFALCTKAKNVYLIGYDGHCRRDKPNFYDTQRVAGYMKSDHDLRLKRMLKLYDVFPQKERERVVNLSPESSIGVFRKKSLKEHFGWK